MKISCVVKHSFLRRIVFIFLVIPLATTAIVANGTCDFIPINNSEISNNDLQVSIDSICRLKVDSLIFSNNQDYQEKIIAIDKLYVRSCDNYGVKSEISAYILHKKGVLYSIMGYEGIPHSFDSAIINTQKAIKIRIELNHLKKIDIANKIINGYLNVGLYFSLKGDYANSLINLLEGLEYMDNFPLKDNEFDLELKLYTQTARTYLDLGDYDQAAKHYQNIIDYPINNHEENNQLEIRKWKLKTYLEVSALYAIHLQNPEESIFNIEKGQKILEKYFRDNFLYYSQLISNKKGLAYYILSKYDSASLYFHEAIKLNLKNNDLYYLAENQMNLGITLNKLNILDSSEYYLIEAKKQFDRTNRKYRFASIYDNLGDLEYKKGKFLKSLEYDNLSMTYMIGEFDPKSIFENPIVSSKNISDKLGILISLSSKAGTFKQLHLVNNNEEYLMAAYTTFQLADQIIGMMRSEFQAEASRMSLASYAKPIYEQGIEACYLLYQLQPHDSLLNKAFEYAEKSKAIVLLDAVRKTNARAHVNPELILTEKALNLKANYFEKQAALSEQDSIIRYSYGVYDSLLYYRRQRQKVIDQIKESTPEYYSLIFDQATTSPATIQQNLSRNQAFVEYFLGDSSLYTFAITGDTSLFQKYDQPDSIRKWVKNWTTSIKQMDMNYLTPSYKLYTALIEPVKKYIDLPEKLIIVPDEILNLVNYEVLTSELPSNERIYLPTFDKYLIYDHQVCYAFSASTLEESSAHHQKKSKRYLGIAPPMNEGFYWHENWFDKLDYNQEEVLQAASLFRRKDVIESASAKEQFMEMAPDHGLIHCATHAMANNTDGDLSFIIFGKDDSDIIYAKDLYALDLNADLVVLSACQTSAGELNRGEGIISLARSFTYAGAASVVTSLWNVREITNKEIIYNFYRLLKKGESKDEALRSAKLDYLNNITRDNQVNAHPYFWSTMVVIGDTSPLQTNLSTKLIIVAFVVFLSVAVLYLRYQKRRTKSRIS